MRARLIFFATLGLASMAACGGGGSNPSPRATPTPTPAPTNNDSRPATAGDTFAYAGNMTVQFVRPPQTVGVVPSPNPANTQTLSYTTTQKQTVATGQTFNGQTNAVAFTTAETDTLLGGLATTSSSSTEYYFLGTAGTSIDVRDIGGTVENSAGDSLVTMLGGSNGLVDVLPEVAGSIAVPADASAVTNETDADGQTDVRTTDTDGTYSETITYIDGTTATGTANADGSGTFSFPIGYPDNAIFQVAAPVATSSPSSIIPITITYPAGFVVTPNVSPTPYVRMRTVTTWYPQPLVISKKSLVNSGQTAIPASCNVPSAYLRSSSNALVNTTSTVDPLFGELDTRTTTQYTEPGVGVACVTLNDVLQQFYDYSEQAGQYVTTSSTPVQTTTTTETLGLTSETVIGLSSVARSAMVNSSRAHFAAVLDRKRAIRHAAIAKAVRATLVKNAGGR